MNLGNYASRSATAQHNFQIIANTEIFSDYIIT